MIENDPKTTYQPQKIPFPVFAFDKYRVTRSPVLRRRKTVQGFKVIGMRLNLSH
jgi:hypothetical protein